MGQHQSGGVGELLYTQAVEGNVQVVKALCRQGASLEWIDGEGKTPLIVTCMSSELFVVAKTLIELGANVNAYRPGRCAGNPLHHAAKIGLHQIVKLLLSHGANPFVRNDECQTPLDIARREGFIDVVRAIESHICFFSGWMREFYGLGFLKALAPQLLSRKIWVVIIPCGPHESTRPLKLEVVIYPNLLDSRPRTVIALWEANIEEPNFQQSDPVLIIFDESTKTRYRFATANDGDQQQLQWLYMACRGIPQVMPPLILHNTQTYRPVTATQTAVEAVELAMAMTASIQSAMEDKRLLPKTNGWGNATGDSSHNGWGSFGGPTVPSEASSSGRMEPPKEEYNGWCMPQSGPTPSEASSSGWMNVPAKEEYNGWGKPESRPTAYTSQYAQTPDNILALAPSAPPVPEEDLDKGSIHYPSVFSHEDIAIPSVEHGSSRTSEAEVDSASSLCVVCWEAPVEGACVPCGHMAVCMTCLNEIKSKQGACPVCRAKIDQVIRIYTA